MKTTAEIRREFLDFFVARGHREVRSSSLVPANDPTLLFTNAGMVQFKDVFLGAEKRDYKRAATAQRCVRAGGKHNDLENVGYTARHHTFFEMLGNFSFGDYFKREAIEFAWEFLTANCGFAPERLWVTVYEEDNEAAAIWLDEIGVDPARLSRIGDKPGKRFESDNFWAMGDTGPCGPCSEIFYDHGPDVPGGPPGTPEEDGDRYIEIWNLVFMQFDRAADGTLKPLPRPCVDTGMGLERLAAVLQGVHSNYEIDLFRQLIQAAAEKTGTRDLDQASLKVIADHIRACAFLIADGVLPANEGRGYVLRRIIRRAIRHGYKLGCKQSFFAAMVEPLVEAMGDAYSELGDSKEIVEGVLATEEERFRKTLTNGMNMVDIYTHPAYVLMPLVKEKVGIEDFGLFHSSTSLGSRETFELDATDGRIGGHQIGFEFLLDPSLALPHAKKIVSKIWKHNQNVTGGYEKLYLLAVGLPLEVETALNSYARSVESLEVTVLSISSELYDQQKVLDGKQLFKLYDTYGFPVDMTADICRERGFKPDLDGFRREMEKQRKQARAAGQFNARDNVPAGVVADMPATEFLGYEQNECDSARVVAILVDGAKRESLSQGESGLVILDRTTFYAASGGQVGDTGTLETNGIRFRVDDTRKLAGAYHVHDGTLESGSLKVGDTVCAAIDEQRRADIVRHHSATHLLHAALRDILGAHVQQKGSLVAPDRLRFDFSHFEPLTDEQIDAIEQRVNEQIQANEAASASVMDYDEALAAGALAFFGDKYGDRVRVLRFGDYSTELCGGTHVDRVGDIGVFKILSETGISAGVRRIEAVAGRQAVAWMQHADRSLREIAARLKSTPAEAGRRVDQLLERSRELEKQLERIKGKLAAARGSDLGSNARDINGLRVVSQKLEGADPNSLRDTVDQLKNKLGSAVIVLGTVADGGVRLVAGVTGDLTDRVRAGELVNFVAGQVGGKGGGRPDFAQAGGTDARSLDSALESVYQWVEKKTG